MLDELLTEREQFESIASQVTTLLVGIIFFNIQRGKYLSEPGMRSRDILGRLRLRLRLRLRVKLYGGSDSGSE